MFFAVKISIYFLILMFTVEGFGSPIRCNEIFEVAISSPVKRFDTPSVVKNSFVTNRTLPEYEQLLTKEFIKDLESLTADETWVDFGAGKALPAEDYLLHRGPSAKANVLAITYKYKRWFPKYKGPKLKIQQGKFFEELTELPQFSLGSDVYGIFSYTQHLDYYLFLTLKHLKIGKKIFIKSDFYLTGVRSKEGKIVSILSWLSQLPGISVQLHQKQTIVILKESESIHIPRLKLEFIDGEMPPTRIFREM